MKLKKINFQIIDPKQQPEPYELLGKAIDLAHDDLQEAKIGLAWKLNEQADQDGHLILGKCVKVSDLHKEFGAFDFIIVLNRDVWDDLRFTDDRKLALLDHELCHAARAEDPETGETKLDERNRIVWRTRKHDIEEFQGIVQRHGLWKRDLEMFAEAIMQSKKSPLFDAKDDILGAPSREGLNSDSPIADALAQMVAPVDGKGITSISMMVPGHPETEVTITADDAKHIRSAATDGGVETLYPDALATVREAGKATTSLLQRNLNIGYGAAVGLIDLMEERGVVGPADGSNQRKLLPIPNIEGTGKASSEGIA